MTKPPRQSVFRTREVTLTPRHQELLRHLAAGKTTHQAAHVMGLTERTAECYRQRIMEYTGCHTPIHLGVWAARNGYAPEPTAASQSNGHSEATL